VAIQKNTSGEIFPAYIYLGKEDEAFSSGGINIDMTSGLCDDERYLSSGDIRTHNQWDL